MMMMLVYMYKSQSQALIIKQLAFHTLKNLSLTTPIFRRYGTKRIIPTTDFSEFRTSFLKNKCGLSGKTLITATKYLTFDPSDQRPDSVLNLFRTFGFPQSSITRIITSNPRILEFYPGNVIKPKLDFLLSMTLSQTEVIAIVTKNPRILSASLKNQLIPLFNLINSVIGSYPKSVNVVKCMPFVLTYSISNCFLPNMEFLLQIGVPNSQISKLFTYYTRVFGRKHEIFCKDVLKVKEMGFDLSSSYFLHAVNTLSYLTDSTWKSKCELLRRFGFSSDDFISIFKKLPSLMSYSEKRLNERMEFFINKLRWSPSKLATNPVVLSYSLEKRTIPRCLVLQALVLRKSTTKSFTLSSILILTEQQFLEKYVTPYMDEIPEVMEAYKGKLRFDDHNFKLKVK